MVAVIVLSSKALEMKMIWLSESQKRKIYVNYLRRFHVFDSEINCAFITVHRFYLIRVTRAQYLTRCALLHRVEIY